MRVIDSMPPRDEAANLVRIVEGVSGRVPMRMELAVRLDYGAAVPWVRHSDDGLSAVSGPDALHLRTPVDVRGENMRSVADFEVAPGDRVPFTMDWHPSHLPGAGRDRPVPRARGHRGVLARMVGGVQLRGRLGRRRRHVAAGTQGADVRAHWRHRRRAHHVAARGARRGAQLGLPLLLDPRRHAHPLRARPVRLRRGGAGVPRLAPARGQPAPPASSRSCTASPGSGGCPSPSWAGCRATRARRRCGRATPRSSSSSSTSTASCSTSPGSATRRGGRPAIAWKRQLALMAHLETVAFSPDEGIWEVRGPRRHFVHSKVMAWVAFDRAIKLAEASGQAGPVDRWRVTREAMHRDICEKGFDRERNTFTQYYGSRELDASLLLIPVCRLPPAGRPARARHRRRCPRGADRQRLRLPLHHGRR